VQVQNLLKPHLKYKIFNFLVSNNSGVGEDVIVGLDVYVGFFVSLNEYVNVGAGVQYRPKNLRILRKLFGFLNSSQ
jgi:hypothetical protein